MQKAVQLATAARAQCTAEEALQQAEAEGLTLQPSDNNATGFKGVRFSSSGKPTPDGFIERPNLVADLCKIIERQSSQIFELRACLASTTSQPSASASHPAAPPSMGMADVPQPAMEADAGLHQPVREIAPEAEGLTLQRSDDATGSEGVTFNSGGMRSGTSPMSFAPTAKSCSQPSISTASCSGTPPLSFRLEPYEANVTPCGEHVHLGSHSTAESAALCYTLDAATEGDPTAFMHMPRVAAIPAPPDAIWANPALAVPLPVLMPKPSGEGGDLLASTTPLEGQQESQLQGQRESLLQDQPLIHEQQQAVGTAAVTTTAITNTILTTPVVACRKRKAGAGASQPSADAAAAAAPYAPAAASSPRLYRLGYRYKCSRCGQPKKSHVSSGPWGKRRRLCTADGSASTAPAEALMLPASHPNVPRRQRNRATPAAAPTPRPREDALRQAKAEGLTLQPSDNESGFEGVNFIISRAPAVGWHGPFSAGSASASRFSTKPYEASVRRGDHMVSLGYFVTAEEAALCYARNVAASGAHGGEPTIGAAEERMATTNVPQELDVAIKAAAATSTPAALTAEEALQQAEVEGLALEPSSNAVGFKGVGLSSSTGPKPYSVQVARDGRKVYLGSFVTAEEAALCYARSVAAHSKAVVAAAASVAAKEALRVAEAEGLTLQTSDNGYVGVTFIHNHKGPRPYRVQIARDGTHVDFATAEEAALCYALNARDVAANASAAAAAPTPRQV